jgi:ribonuclease BN (tRNA processing enzyme)
MKLILLGTNGFMPTDEAQTACYFLPEPGILLDAGSGSYRLYKYLQSMPLDVYISHAHGDHTSGLTYLFASYYKKIVDDAKVDMNVNNAGGFMQHANDVLHSTCIHGTPSTLKEVQELYQRFQYQYQPLQSQEPLRGGGVLTHFRLDHGPMECVGYRLNWSGHSMAYVTDTVSHPDSAYIKNIYGVDLLLHECNNPDQSATLAEMIHHTYTSVVAQVAAAAHVKRLVLIHHAPFDFLDIRPDMEAARRIFSNIEIGQDGMELEF